MAGIIYYTSKPHSRRDPSFLQELLKFFIKLYFEEEGSLPDMSARDFVSWMVDHYFIPVSKMSFLDCVGDNNCFKLDRAIQVSIFLPALRELEIQRYFFEVPSADISNPEKDSSGKVYFFLENSMMTWVPEESMWDYDPEGEFDDIWKEIQVEKLMGLNPKKL